MTDSFEVKGDILPDTFISATETHWAATPDVVKPEAVVPEAPVSGFVPLGLADELMRALADLDFIQPTAVQAHVIPQALGSAHGGADSGDGSAEAHRFIDLMVSSQTGSGKTAAFLLPVLHTLLTQQRAAEVAARREAERLAAEAIARGEAPARRPKRKNPTDPRHFKPATPGALVLCPTRELAQQVAHDAIDLVRHCLGLRIASVVGGLPYAQQIARLQNASLVVATPGRLLDLEKSGQLKLDQVQFLVIDEADRMLDLGFADDLAEVNRLTAQRRQTMMFSATFAPRIMSLAARAMRDPQRVQIDSPQERHQNISETLHWADNPRHKRQLLDHWLRDTKIEQAIVFSNTQIECDSLAAELAQDGFSAVALHGALSQGMRNRRLMMIREGRVQILVATDVAARGLDVPSISHVINYGLPMKAEDYTHRIGRTGRAGRNGQAITIAEFRDRRRISDIEQYTRQTFKPSVIAGLEPQQRAPSGFGGKRFGGPGGDSRRHAGFNDAPRGRPGPGARSGGFGASQAPFGKAENDNRHFGGGQFDNNGPRRRDSFAGAGAPDIGRAAPRGAAPRGQFGGRAAAGKAGPGAGKVFVPRDAKKRAARKA